MMKSRHTLTIIPENEKHSVSIHLPLMNALSSFISKLKIWSKKEITKVNKAKSIHHSMNTVTMACFRIRIDRLSNARTNGRRKIERKVEAGSLLETLLSVKLSHKSKNLQAIQWYWNTPSRKFSSNIVTTMITTPFCLIHNYRYTSKYLKTLR